MPKILYAKLRTIKEWVNDTFEEGSKPQERTVRNWLLNGDLRGRKIGAVWFVTELDHGPSSLVEEYTKTT